MVKQRYQRIVRSKKFFPAAIDGWTGHFDKKLMIDIYIFDIEKLFK
jgi:hypothetical protein